MKHPTACPNCGQYKLRPRRIGLISAGVFFLFVSAILIPFDPFFIAFQLAFVLASIGLIVLSVFVKGQVCANCKYRLSSNQSAG